MSQKIEIHLESYDSPDGLNIADRALLEVAVRRLGTGHAPYSGFHVSAAVKTQSGAMYVGTNQENASYPVGICAERVALSVSNMQSKGNPSRLWPWYTATQAGTMRIHSPRAGCVDKRCGSRPTARRCPFVSLWQPRADPYSQQTMPMIYCLSRSR